MAEDRDNHERSQAGKAPQTAPIASRPEDEAAQGLADALHLSFRLLTVIMVIFVVMFLWTGVKTVAPYEVGIKLLFGRPVGLAEEGLTIFWPFPVGEILTINTQEQGLTVDDFWLFERPEDKTKDLLSRRSMGPGLKPGFEGALLTGDRGLLHVRMTCTYVVREPMKFAVHVASDVRDAKVNETIRSVLCDAAIRQAARRTVDALQRTERDRFASEVRSLAQEQLTQLETGIVLKTVLLTETTWPLRALPAYTAAQRAVSEAEQSRNRARGEAQKILNDAAGTIYPQLVGDPSQSRDEGELPEDGEPYDLINQYDQARSAGDEAAAAALLEQIEEVLLSNRIGGQAARVIAEARSDRTAIEQRVLSRAKRFRELLPEYQISGQFLLDRLWAQTRDRILDSPTVEKLLMTTSGRYPTVLRINRDPGIAGEIERELARPAESNEKRRPGRGSRP